jgi:hypothetical protein
MSDNSFYNDPIANKPSPTADQLANKSVSGKKAYLRKLNWKNEDVYGQYKVNNNDRSYVSPQPEHKFDLWVTEVNYGYSMKGVDATSRYYKKYYPQAYGQLPISVRGTTINEKEYNYLASFIREQQTDVTTDHNNLLLLEIPAAGVSAVGLIESFIGGVQSNGQGIPVAPEFEFSFTVIENLNDYKDTHDDGRSFSEIMLITGNKDTVTLLTDESFQLELMYKGSQDPGDIKPAVNSPKKTPTRSKTGKNNSVNKGTNNTRGRLRAT